ncbi:hypothetical protein EVAR_92884_1 [Eumeta japonica]|uniref:Uncharacterized protein n=1 Tax=Eumeta variegata TaxID=151549 RepID=A0A4C1TB43_EUMVA|nr:hypothetical protein EVAR_92884_1 [Eumeta japonica]
MEVAASATVDEDLGVVTALAGHRQRDLCQREWRTKRDSRRPYLFADFAWRDRKGKEEAIEWKKRGIWIGGRRA